MGTVVKSRGRIVQDTRRPKVSITLPVDLLAKVDAEADENYVSRSAVIVVALREHFAK
jgi:metal-responsive CopG/Arc/MetJ family transcriptional regulator